MNLNFKTLQDKIKFTSKFKSSQQSKLQFVCWHNQCQCFKFYYAPVKIFYFVS